MQQLLRDWESRFLSKANSPTAHTRARAVTAAEGSVAPGEQSLEVLFVSCPCDQCGHRQDCASGLACERYAMFLDGRPRKDWEAAVCEPTQAAFKTLFGAHRVAVAQSD
jgi:hypothetical protein